MNLKDELDNLASLLVAETKKKEVPFADIIDTFKELRAYYALTLKNTPDSAASDDGGFDFANGIGDRNGATGIQRRGNS